MSLSVNLGLRGSLEAFSSIALRNNSLTATLRATINGAESYNFFPSCILRELFRRDIRYGLTSYVNVSSAYPSLTSSSTFPRTAFN